MPPRSWRAASSFSPHASVSLKNAGTAARLSRTCAGLFDKSTARSAEKPASVASSTAILTSNNGVLYIQLWGDASGRRRNQVVHSRRPARNRGLSLGLLAARVDRRARGIRRAVDANFHRAQI